jgi:aspartate/methionine/tyrosine aminotransferase
MGKVVMGAELAAWVATARELDCTLLMDEFYSHYIYKQGTSLVSATEFVEDVDRDPVVVFDGLTKNWRYPGWRVSWTVGPKQVIEAVSSAGSFLDGGGSRPMQLAALPLLTEAHGRQETGAIQACFKQKRNKMVDGLRAMGVRFEREPEGTFYAWGHAGAASRRRVMRTSDASSLRRRGRIGTARPWVGRSANGRRRSATR